MVVLDASLAGESGAEDSFGRGVTAVGDRDAIVGGKPGEFLTRSSDLLELTAVVAGAGAGLPKRLW